MSKVNLKALSKHLGLTEGTISRAINNYPDISAHTRQRVMKAVDELGYRANSNARRLATGNAECIGYVLPWQMGHISEPFLGELLDGLTSALSERQWDLMLTISKSAEDELAIISRLVQSGRVNGLVISRTLTHDPRIDHMIGLGIPFVTHGRTSKSDNHAWFDIDNIQAFKDAVDHLVGLDHEKIAHIYGPQDYNFAAQRKEGYRQGLANHGIALNPLFEVQADMSEKGGFEAMQYLLALKDLPTAVVCVSDMVALGVMKAIREAGLTPGREISVIGYDGLPLGAHSYPALTTMSQPLQTAGKRIGEMLLGVIDGDKPTDHQELLQASLTRRQSDGPVCRP